jgi:hypothetical protein
MIKNQKPTNISYHLKYICPNRRCKNEHWLSSKEGKVKNFKIVCDCGKIFSPLPIKKIKICYTTIKKHKEKKIVQTEPVIDLSVATEEIEHVETIDDIKCKFAETLRAVGFTDELEILNIFDYAYAQCETNDIGKLFKIGVLNN